MITWEDVITSDGRLRAVAADGERRVILDSRTRPASFRPGWAARGLLRLGEAGAVMDLVHADGTTAAWILDGQSRVIASSPWQSRKGSRLPAWVALRPLFAAALQPMLRTMLRDPVALLTDPDFVTLQRLSIACRTGLLRSTALPTLRARTLLDEVHLPSTTMRERLKEIFELDWKNLSQSIFRTGRLSMPALTGPAEARQVAFVRLDSGSCLVQARDAPGQPCWIALFHVGKWTTRGFMNWVLLPDGETLVTPKNRDSSLAEAQLGLLASLYAAAGNDIGPWFRKPAGPALAYRPGYTSHLGHLVWNNLSAVHNLLSECEASGQPLVVYDLSVRPGADIYGSLGQLFPEPSIKVHRPIDGDLADITRLDLDVKTFVEATRERRHLLSFRLAEIPTSLRERIQRSVSKDMIARAVAPFARMRLGRDGHGQRRPVLALSIRLQNRSVPDLVGFYEQVVRHLCATCAPEGMFVIVDGMNAMPSGDIRAPDGLIQREIAAVEDLRLRVADCPVEVISCVGMTMAENLVWLEHADMFVAPQGGGLTKFRWVLNIPGYVLTSAINRKMSKRVFLYSHKGDTEDPAPLLANRADDVEDLFPPGPDGTPLASFEGGSGGLSSVNFRIANPARILDEIEGLFRASINFDEANRSSSDKIERDCSTAIRAPQSANRIV